LADFVEILIEAGATFATEVTVTDANGLPLNLSNYQARAQLRKSYYSMTAVNFATEITDSSAGIISLGITAANTANIRAGRYVYDVEIENDNGVVTRIFEGIATVSPNVTR
jgi:hypothetical protein